MGGPLERQKRFKIQTAIDLGVEKVASSALEARITTASAVSEHLAKPTRSAQAFDELGPPLDPPEIAYLESVIGIHGL